MCESDVFLHRCQAIDIKKYLEQKIIESQFGVWERQTYGADAKYPERIYCSAEQDLSSFGDVKYFIDDRQVEQLPSRIASRGKGEGHTPSWFRVTIDDKVTYLYRFSNKTAPGYSYPINPHTDLYPVLYAMMQSR
jgi:hypothetical protein